MKKRMQLPSRRDVPIIRIEQWWKFGTGRYEEVQAERSEPGNGGTIARDDWGEDAFGWKVCEFGFCRRHCKVGFGRYACAGRHGRERGWSREERVRMG